MASMKVLPVTFGFFATLLFPFTGFCQNSFFSAGAEIGLPNADGLKMVAGTLTGGSLRGEATTGKHTALFATIGYLASSTQNPYSSTPATTSKYSAVPFHVGFKYYIKEKGAMQKGFFFSGEL